MNRIVNRLYNFILFYSKINLYSRKEKLARFTSKCTLFIKLALDFIMVLYESLLTDLIWFQEL